MTYHAVSIFIDVLYRYSKLEKNIYKIDSTISKTFNNSFNEFYSDTTRKASLGSSATLRYKIMELIALTQGKTLKGFGVINDPEEISIKSFRNRKEEIYWQVKYFFQRVPEKIINLFRVLLNNLYSNNKYRIGYIYMQKEYFNQLSNIDFINIDKNIVKNDLNVSIVDRKKLFLQLFPKFHKKVHSFKEWKLFSGIEIDEKLIQILFSLISLKIEPSIVDRGNFQKIIDGIKIYLKNKKFNALFSVGNWFRIDNALIALAARNLKIPIIQFQSGGGSIYLTRTGLKRDIRKFVNYYFSWSDWKSLMKEEDKKNTKIIKIPDFRLIQIYNRRRKSYKPEIRQNTRIYRLLYMPVGFSNPYISEMYNNYDENMLKSHRLKCNKIFQTLDRSNLANNIKLYVKVKMSGNKLYKGYEYMLIPDIKLSKIDINFLYRGNSNWYFNSMDVCLTDGMSTTLAESIASNIPTVCYWNTEMMKIKPMYEKLVSDLIDLGVIVTDELKAFSVLNRLYEDPNWWYSLEVQDVRKMFIDVYAYHNNNWVSELNNGFMSVLNASK